jgi:hypothetical protein
MESGTYEYFLNGNPTGVIETFRSEILPDGSKFTTSTRDATPFKTKITVETTEKENKFQNCRIGFQKDEIEIESNYEFSEKTFHIWRKINGEIIQDETFDWPENAVFFPLMRCFQGQTILEAGENQDFTIVIVPDIQGTTAIEDFLQPTFDERTAKLISTNENQRVFKYLSKHYDENSEFHLDKNGLMIYYKFVQNENQTWEVSLNSAFRIPHFNDLRPTNL